MKFKTLLLGLTGSFLVSLSLCAQQVKRAYLDDSKPLFCPIGASATLTIQFPAPLESVVGMGFVSDTEQKKGDYSLYYEEGRTFLSIAPRNENAPPRNLNIIFGGKTYVLVPFITNNPAAAWMSLVLSQVEHTPEVIESKAKLSTANLVKKRSVPLLSTIKDPSPAQLLGLIDSLKLLSTVEGAEQERIITLMKHLEVAVELNQQSHFGTHIIAIDKVVRHKNIDALGLEISLQNLSDKPLYISPESFSVRVGEQLFQQSMSDAPTTLAGHETQKAYLVICGNGVGGSNWLSTNNRFIVSVDTE